MYSGITNIYYRKTVGQVCTKPVQIGRRAQNVFSPSKLFFIVVHISAARWCECVCSEKIAAPGEKSFCVLEYHTSNSVITVQRAFRSEYAKDPPTDKTIRARQGSLQQWSISMHPCWRVCAKNLNIVSMCAVSTVVHTSNISSCQKKLFQFSCGCEQFH
jgi:hypothetical protein